MLHLRLSDKPNYKMLFSVAKGAETCDVKADSGVQMAEPMYETVGGYSIYGCTVCPSQK